MTTLEDKGRHTYRQHTPGRTESRGQEIVETMPLPTKWKAKWEVKLWEEEEEDERTEETTVGGDQIKGEQERRLPDLWSEFHQRKPTWSELFNASIVVGGVDWEEVFEPGDVRVWVATSGTEHGGSACSLHHFQLWAHVYGGEARGQLVLWRQRRMGAEVRFR